MIEYPLSEDQIIASDKISRFLNSKTSRIFLLTGGAGTGKTSIVTDLLNPENTLFLGATNKVVKVLKDRLTKGMSLSQKKKVKVMTIARFLGFKMTKDHNNKTKYEYKSIIEIKESLEGFENVVIDEVSLINDDVIKYIKQIATESKVLLIGDEMQIPPIGETNRNNEGFLCSKIFSITNDKANLIINHRQKEGALLSNFCQEFRKNMDIKIPLLKMKSTKWVDGDGILFFDSDSKYDNDDFIQEIKNEDSLCVAYKNLTVLKYDWLIGSVRSGSMRYKSNEFNKGDKVFFNEFYRWEDTTFYTTDDVEIVDVVSGERDSFLGVEYSYTEMSVLDTYGNKISIRVSDGYNETLRPIYNRKITLFKNALSNEDKARVNTAYANFKNSFAKLKRKTAITSHKAQGSEYSTVIIPINDYSNRIPKDANQLLYVAISRATEKIILVNNDDIYEKGGRKILTEASKNAIASRDGYQCQMCGVEKYNIRFFDIDHKTPLKRGGSNSASNLQILCKPCHAIKTKKEA